MPRTSRQKTTERAPTRAARIRGLAEALGATGRATSSRARAAVAADGVGKEEAAKQLAAQAITLEDAMRDLSDRFVHTVDVEGKRVISDQIDVLQETHKKVLGQQIRAAFDEEKVKSALAKLARITDNLQQEAKVLKRATDIVASVAKLVGFVDQGLMVLAGVHLLAA